MVKSDLSILDEDHVLRSFRIGYGVAAVSGFLMWLMTAIWVFKYNGGIAWDKDKHPEQEINLHVLFMIFFMVYLHGLSSLMYRLIPRQSQSRIKLIHSGIHLISGLGGILGLSSAFRSATVNGDGHFKSLHSWLGLAAIFIFVGMYIGGFVILFLPLVSTSVKNFVLSYHVMWGRILFLVSILAAATGLMMKTFVILFRPEPTPTNISSGQAKKLMKAAQDIKDTEIALVNFSGMFLLIFATVVTHLLYENRFRRRTISEEIVKKPTKSPPSKPPEPLSESSSGLGQLESAEIQIQIQTPNEKKPAIIAGN